MFEKIYGLSCVENQVLAILREKGNDISHLYYNSGMSLKRVFNFIVLQEQNPYYFKGISRIQDVLSQKGVLEIVFSDLSYSEVCDVISKLSENEFCLVKVTPEFTKKLGARGFRDDHFVRVKYSDDQFMIYNDIPEKVVSFTAEQFEQVYAGQCLVFKIKKPIDSELKQNLYNSRDFRPEDYEQSPFDLSETSSEENLGIKLRNMIQIYKTMCYRMAEYYKNLVDTEFITKLMPQIEQLYALCEYYNLKKNTEPSRFAKIFEQIKDIDNKIMQELKTLLGGDENGQ